MIPDTEDHLDSRESLVRTTLDCYLSTILAISEFLNAFGSEMAAPHQDQLVRLRKRLAFHPSADALEESRDTLRSTLLAFAAQVRERQDAQAGDLRRVTILLAQAGDGLALRKDGYSDQFRHVVRQMDEIDAREDPAAARSRLQAQLEKLRGFLEQVYDENAKAFARLREGVEECRVRLGSSAAGWPTDPVTGLADRPEMERRIEVRLEAEEPFCILFFQLEGMFGDAVLQQVGAALDANIRPRDFVSRWGKNEFVILLECDAPSAHSRAHQIAQWLSGQYRVNGDGLKSLVQVKLTVGIAERTADDTVQRIVERATAARVDSD